MPAFDDERPPDVPGERREANGVSSHLTAIHLGVIVIAAGVFALTILLGNESYDDAYIAYRYAEHWPDGIGLRWNPEDPPVYGASSLSHCFLLMIGKLIGMYPRTTSIGIQTVSHVLVSVLAFLLAGHLAGCWAGLGAAMLTAISLPNVFQGQGLEMELYTALTLLALWLSIKERHLAAGLAAGLAVVT